MKTKISINNFSFLKTASGRYSVTYTSPVSGKSWTNSTNDMPLIDATKNEEKPKISDLNALKNICKNKY